MNFKRERMNLISRSAFRMPPSLFASLFMTVNFSLSHALTHTCTHSHDLTRTHTLSHALTRTHAHNSFLSFFCLSALKKTFFPHCRILNFSYKQCEKFNFTFSFLFSLGRRLLQFSNLTLTFLLRLFSLCCSGP